MVLRDIDHDSPQPSFERAIAAESGQVAHCPDEALLDNVWRCASIAADRRGDTSELEQTLAVDHLDLPQTSQLAVPVHAHHFTLTRDGGDFVTRVVPSTKQDRAQRDS